MDMSLSRGAYNIIIHMYMELCYLTSTTQYTELLEVRDKVTVSVTATDITAIEEFTRAQNQSFAWYTQRAGRITASKILILVIQLNH